VADLIIKARAGTGSERGDGTEMVSRRGDLVAIRPTGSIYGAREVLPPNQGGGYVRITLLRDDGVTPVWSLGDPMPPRLADFIGPEADAFVPSTIVRKFAHRVVVDDLPTTVRNQLARDGQRSLKWTAVRDFLARKADDWRASQLSVADL
jgi:hypothetical protein